MPSPLIKHIYTADPSAHYFNGRIYIYPSHDRETPIEDNDNGDQYDMIDYHVFSLPVLPLPEDTSGSTTTTHSSVIDHGPVLSVEQVAWADKQLWAPDAAHANGSYYLYFPARDREGIFRIGVAVSSKPEGPFTPQPEPISGSYSIDPCSFVDDDGKAYLYFGGVWGGQLQCWKRPEDDLNRPETFHRDAYTDMEASGTTAEYALLPRVAQLSADMLSFATSPRGIEILDPVTIAPLLAHDHDRRFFEAPWMHKRRDTYYFSYSTGNTHYIAYATAKSPLGPFVYQGRLMEPVLGWTTHHSIVRVGGEKEHPSDRWWLFYHDCELSGGINHLRSVKVRELFYDDEGRMVLGKE